MGLKLDMCMCVCARVRIRAFSARVNSGVRSRAAPHLCIVFFREEKNGLCSRVKRPATAPPPPFERHSFSRLNYARADTGRNPTPFRTHGSKARNRFARNDPSHVQRVTIE